MIDLQQEKLVMFVGRQMQPQEKKPYGAAGERYSGIKEAYYACRLCVTFSFRYIRTFSSEEVVGDMERAVQGKEILKLEAEISGNEGSVRDEHADEKKRLTLALNRLDEKMKSLTERLDKIQLTSRNMPRNLNCAVSAATDACAKLEMQIESMT